MKQLKANRKRNSESGAAFVETATLLAAILVIASASISAPSTKIGETFSSVTGGPGIASGQCSHDYAALSPTCFQNLSDINQQNVVGRLCRPIQHQNHIAHLGPEHAATAEVFCEDFRTNNLDEYNTLLGAYGRNEDLQHSLWSPDYIKRMESLSETYGFG